VNFNGVVRPERRIDTEHHPLQHLHSIKNYVLKNCCHHFWHTKVHDYVSGEA